MSMGRALCHADGVNARLEPSRYGASVRVLIDSRAMHASCTFSCTVALVALLAAGPRAAPGAAHRVIFDTDFALPPQDDGLALALALNSPELDIVGITTVAGNFNLARANADVLRMLEITRHGSIPVHAGARRPLVHVKDDFAATQHGTWWSDEPPPAPPGGFARKALESETAVDFMIRTVMANRGQIDIIALGPLTNVAMAIRKEPAFASAVKRTVIMGGAIAALPDGAGNITPNAEFNFWVDPEAARIVLRSGIPIELSTLNVSRKTALTKRWYDRLVAVDTPLTQMIRSRMDQVFVTTPNRALLMFDEVAVASLIDPTLVKTEQLVVDVDIDHGINYGVSVGGRTPWPGAEGARTVAVQHDLDWDRFITMFIERVTKRLD
jgi:inosine-uridine nucleoside N-ribohydrolase